VSSDRVSTAGSTTTSRRRVTFALLRARSGPTDTAAISVEKRRSPLTSYSRTERRPLTTTGSPLTSDVSTPSANRRQQLTDALKRSPSIHSPAALSQRRSELATRKLTSRCSSAPTRREVTSPAMLPVTVTIVSFTVVPVPGWWPGVVPAGPGSIAFRSSRAEMSTVVLGTHSADGDNSSRGAGDPAADAKKGRSRGGVLPE
jgi:hypothetical protein